MCGLKVSQDHREGLQSDFPGMWVSEPETANIIDVIGSAGLER